MSKKKVSTSVDVNKLIANETIITTDISDEIESSMLTYAVKTIIDRAIPSVEDGLKPVQRRILYAAYESGYLPSKRYVKNAAIVGDVMGKYHPHGDGSIYDAEVSMSQHWNYRYPLIDFYGNNGSFDGDGPAAMRYTEGRLDKKALTILEDIDNKAVDFKPNYSETVDEPVVLPGLFPNLLLNGASGIATGYTTDLPSHQLGEVVDGIIEVIKNPKCDLDDIMKHIKGPDFAGGGYLLNNEKIKELYSTGKASLTFKGKYEIEQNNETGNNQIVFTELPPTVNKPKLVEQIYNLCLEEKVIPRVIDVRDESEANGVRIVIELHKTAVPDIIVKELYTKTPLQKNTSFVLRAIVNQAPKILTLKEIIEHYIEHRRSVISRRTKHALDKVRIKLHIQEGFEIVTNNIDKAIKIIRESDNDKVAKEELIKFFKLSDAQANEVLDMKLRQLTKLNKSDILDTIKKYQEEIKKYENILSGVQEVDKVIISELRSLKSDFNDERRTTLINEEDANEAAVTSDDPIALVLTSKNTIKHITLKALDDMFKNGTLKERNELFIQGLRCKMSDQFIIILETGEYVKIEFSDLMSNLSFINEKTAIKAIVIYDEENKNKAIVAMTKEGIIKKVKMDGFKARLRRVAPFFELQKGDEIIGVRVCELSDDNIITIATRDGLVHRFFEKSFKETAAGGKGINGISLLDKNDVVDFDIVNQNDDEKSKIVLYTKQTDGTIGMKSMPLTEFKPKGRISQGIKGIEFGKKLNGEVTHMVVTYQDFFTVDKKGNVTIHKFVSLPEHSRYNKPDIINEDILTRKFFLE